MFNKAKPNYFCIYRAMLSELLETEEEFVRDLKFVVQNYCKDEPGIPRELSQMKDTLFGNYKLIQEFHEG